MYVRPFVRLGGPGLLGIAARTEVVAPPTTTTAGMRWARSTTGEAEQTVRTRADMIELLERLAFLKERGALTASEFDAQKAKLLGL